MVRLVHKRAEEGRVEVRNCRREANDACRKAEKASEITEDDLKVMLDDIQTLTDEYVEEINKAMAAKEEELMEV
jgi:ribosome recycling factor